MELEFDVVIFSYNIFTASVLQRITFNFLYLGGGRKGGIRSCCPRTPTTLSTMCPPAPWADTTASPTTALDRYIADFLFVIIMHFTLY